MLLEGTFIPNGHKGRFIGGVEWHTLASHSGTHDDPDIVYQAARFLAHGIRPEGSYRSGSAYECQEDPPPLAGEDSLGVHVIRLTAGPGETADAGVDFDANPSIQVAVLLEVIGASFDLVDAGGLSLVPGDAESSEFQGGQLITFSVEAPSVGPCTLQLAAGDEAASAYVSFAFGNRRSLRLELPSVLLVPLAPATVVGSVRDSTGAIIVGEGGSIEATITLPDEGAQALELFDDGAHGDGAPGDGVFGNVFDGTALGGRYLVDAHCQIAFGAETIERSTMGMFVVDSDPASLVAVTAERPVDNTGDGLYERLEFDIEVSVEEPGSYQLRALLVDSEEANILEDHVLFETDAATPHVATLAFDGGSLVAHGVPAPWTLTQIELFDNTQALLVDTLEDWLTEAYAPTDFAPPAPPIVTHAVPNYGAAAGGNEIILQGGRLEYLASMSIGGTPIAEFEVWSDSAVRVVVPQSDNCSGGPAELELTTAWTSVVLSEVYTYVADPGDFDVDCDSDLADFQLFQHCCTGANVAAAPGCEAADLDGDGDVDFDDFHRLIESSFAGPLH